MLSEKELYELLEKIHKDEISLEDSSISLETVEGLRELIIRVIQRIQEDRMIKRFRPDSGGDIYAGSVTNYLGTFLEYDVFANQELRSSIRNRPSYKDPERENYRIHRSEYYKWWMETERSLERILIQLKQAKVLKKRAGQHQDDINHLCACSIFAKTKELFYKDDHSVPDKQLRDAVYNSLRDSLEGKMFDGFFASTLTQFEDYRRLIEDYSALSRASTEPQKTLAKQLADMERKVDTLTISCNKNHKRIAEQTQEIEELKKTIEQFKNSEAALKRLVSKR